MFIVLMIRYLVRFGFEVQITSSGFFCQESIHQRTEPKGVKISVLSGLPGRDEY